MGNYTQLSTGERRELQKSCRLGESIKEIAKRMGRDSSTLYRELARNQEGGEYHPVIAQQKAQARCSQNRGSKVKRNPTLRTYVVKHLKLGWSPEQIAGRLKRIKSKYPVCHETIYRFIYRSKNL